MDLIAVYELSNIVLRVKDNNFLIALQNRARRMVIGIQSRKEKWVSELKETIPMNDMASELKQRRLNLRRALKN